jgi:hypothetical protein
MANVDCPAIAQIMVGGRHARRPTVCYGVPSGESPTGLSTAGAMTNWQEINRISKDPQAVRLLAGRLLKLPYMSWPEHGRSFLNNMAKERGPITTRQAEYLIELRDETELHQVVGGFSVGSLIEDCWHNREPDRRRGLSDENCEFIERIRGKSALPRRQLHRLFACCRELGLIEAYIDIGG